MSMDELKQAIRGAEFGENRQLQIMRSLTFNILRYISALPKDSTMEKYYPMPFDTEEDT